MENVNTINSIRQKIDFLLKKITCDKTYLSFDELDTASKNINTLEQIIQFTCKYSVDTKNSTFMSKLYSGSDEISLIADILISYFNTNVHVYSVSPVFTLAEEQILDKISTIIGTNSDGIFLPGGSHCNTVAMICARYHAYPESKLNGINKQIKCITSNRSHYSIDKSAIMMGMGTNNVIKIDYDTVTESEMEKIITENNIFMINSTFGTTSEGILESLDKFNHLFTKYKVWHHIDACVGGIALFSTKYKHLTDSFKNADSITLDFHKAMNVSIQCSALIINHPDVLRNVTSIKAEYLFHQDSDHDMSNRSFQCGRKADAFKVWIYDKLDDLDRRSTAFFDRVCSVKKIVQSDDRFEMIYCDSITHICVRINNFNPIHLHELISSLRKKNIFLEYYSDYVRMVPINPDLNIEKIKYILNSVYNQSLLINNKLLQCTIKQ